MCKTANVSIRKKSAAKNRNSDFKSPNTNEKDVILSESSRIEQFNTIHSKTPKRVINDVTHITYQKVKVWQLRAGLRLEQCAWGGIGGGGVKCSGGEVGEGRKVRGRCSVCVCVRA